MRLEEEQKGFRSDKSCNDTMYITKKIREKSN